VGKKRVWGKDSQKKAHSLRMGCLFELLKGMLRIDSLDIKGLKERDILL
jgi:hypothetical protein